MAPGCGGSAPGSHQLLQPSVPVLAHRLLERHTLRRNHRTSSPTRPPAGSFAHRHAHHIGARAAFVGSALAAPGRLVASNTDVRSLSQLDIDIRSVASEILCASQPHLCTVSRASRQHRHRDRNQCCEAAYTVQHLSCSVPSTERILHRSIENAMAFASPRAGSERPITIAQHPRNGRARDRLCKAILP